MAARRRDVGVVDEDSSCVVERHGEGRRELGERTAVPNGNAALQRKPRQRPVHRAGVEVAEREALRETARDRALPCPGGAVNGNDHRLETESRRSKNPGKLIATVSASPTSTPSRDTSPAPAPNMATRW